MDLLEIKKQHWRKNRPTKCTN